MEIKTKTNSIDKMLVLGDMHMSDNLSYSEYIADQRIPEKKAVLDFIVKSAEDCNSIIFLGDNMNSKNNSAESIKEFVEFVERFNNKQIYILLGNHEKRGNGKSALDFMKEIYHPNWHIITKPIQETINGEKVDFLPYMSNPELGVNTYPEAVEAILRGLKGGTYLFAHFFAASFLVNPKSQSSKSYPTESSSSINTI